MLQCQCNISITSKGTNRKVSFNFVHSIEIESSYENLTDTCKITLPRKLTFEGKKLFEGNDPIFKRGDNIEVQIGYVPNITTVFVGYIKNVGTNVPTVLECEDEMYLLKQWTINYPKKIDLITKSKKGKLLIHPKEVPFTVKLKELLDYCLSDHDIEFDVIDNIDLGQRRFVNMTPAGVLDKLKSEYGLYSYFIDKINKTTGKKEIDAKTNKPVRVLHVGFANDAAITHEASFKMEEVIINSDTLEWSRAEDVRIQCSAISMFPDNTKSDPIIVGDPDGNQITIHKYNMNASALKFAAEEWIKENKYTGYRGDVETFGEPVMNHGDRVKLTSVKLPERDGTFLIKKVKRVYSVDAGNHQIFTLGAKVG
jgi:hypothetical protein